MHCCCCFFFKNVNIQMTSGLLRGFSDQVYHDKLWQCLFRDFNANLCFLSSSESGSDFIKPLESFNQTQQGKHVRPWRWEHIWVGDLLMCVDDVTLSRFQLFLKTPKSSAMICSCSLNSSYIYVMLHLSQQQRTQLHHRRACKHV